MRVGNYITYDLDEHVGRIKQQSDKSLRNGETRQLAVKIVSGNYDVAIDPRTGDTIEVVEAWGKNYLAPSTDKPCPPHEHLCEIERIWDFIVLNVRYVEDPYDVDTFCTLKETLRAGGGDCDDMTIGFASLLKSLGYRVKGRVISTSDAPEDWVHIYPLVGMPKNNPSGWIALDASVNGARPGWEYPDRAKVRDYWL